MPVGPDALTTAEYARWWRETGEDELRHLAEVRNACSSWSYTGAMPSPHRRIGLVIDPDVDLALDLVRAQRAHAPTSEAAVARDAVFEGAAISALIALARYVDAPEHARAAELVEGLRELLPTLALPERAARTVTASLGAASSEAGAEARRSRQLGLLDTGDPHAAATLEQLDRFDALEHAG